MGVMMHRRRKKRDKVKKAAALPVASEPAEKTKKSTKKVVKAG